MRIGVLSDSHARSLAELSPKIVERLARMDLILHAGDYTNWQVVEDLRKLGPFRGVAGNMDPMTIASELPERDIVQVQGKRIGLVHGSGGPSGTAQWARRRFPEDVDAIVYGHSHIAKVVVVEGVLMFNPGSASGRFPARYASFGILTIDEEGIRPEIIRV